MIHIDGKLGHSISDGECICDLCIESYIELYEKIERLQELRIKWLANMTRVERDDINRRLKPKEKDLKKKKP